MLRTFGLELVLGLPAVSHVDLEQEARSNPSNSKMS
jgi:hypothetical protein